MGLRKRKSRSGDRRMLLGDVSPARVLNLTSSSGVDSLRAVEVVDGHVSLSCCNALNGQLVCDEDGQEFVVVYRHGDGLEELKSCCAHAAGWGSGVNLCVIGPRGGVYKLEDTGRLISSDCDHGGVHELLKGGLSQVDNNTPRGSRALHVLEAVLTKAFSMSSFALHSSGPLGY